MSLVYVSTATDGLGGDELSELVASSVSRNAERGITGMLLCAAGGFLEELEGPDDEVDAVFASIAQDPRHTDVTVLARESIDTRTHYRWSMGVVDVERSWLAELRAGLPDGAAPTADGETDLRVVVQDVETARRLLRMGPPVLRPLAPEGDAEQTHVVFLQS